METEIKPLKELLEGLVVRAISGFLTVETPGGHVTCHLAGRLKQTRQVTDIVTVGDWVTFSLNKDGTGTIESVAERRSALSRTKPTAGTRRLGSDQEDVLIANLDQVIFVFAVQNPAPSLRKLDRFLVVAEMQALTAVICVNKIDLGDIATIHAQFQVYQDLGYPVIYTSVKQDIGLEDIWECLKNKISVFAGSSGVGKSSLLNRLQPGLGLKVNAVSEATGKGMHTTRYAEMFPLKEGGYIADTPGIRSLALFDLEPSELDAYFREIAPLVTHCQFSDCTHVHEPKCAVRRAVQDGRITAARYQSYLRLREEHESLDEALY